MPWLCLNCTGNFPFPGVSRVAVIVPPVFAPSAFAPSVFALSVFAPAGHGAPPVQPGASLLKRSRLKSELGCGSPLVNELPRRNGLGN
jgi:hypothetical protein